MFIERPPAGILEPAVETYLERMFHEISAELSSFNGILIRNDLPAKPKEGVIYSIIGDGLYYYKGDKWMKIDATEV